MGSMAVHAQPTENDSKTFIGINVGHTIVASSVNSILTKGSLFIPVHINAFRPMSKNFALSGLLLYRAERSPSHNKSTSKFGIAVGPCFTSNYLKGFFADCMIGFAFAIGRDYDRNEYTRTDFVIQPEIGYFINLSDKFSMTFGFAIQSLLRIQENPRAEDTGWEFTDIGKMGQYYLPVLNVSFGVKL